MKQAINSILLIVYCVACTPTKNNILRQDENHWIVLNMDEAKSAAGNHLWEFILNRPGKYDIQIIRDGELDTPLSDLKVETGKLSIKESPKKIFVAGEEGVKQTVYQFGKNIIYQEPSIQTFSVEAGTTFRQVRITPNYRHRFGFGSGKYHAQWQGNCHYFLQAKTVMNQKTITRKNSACE